MDTETHRRPRRAAGAAAGRRGGRAARRARPGGVPRRVRAGRRLRPVRLLRRHRRQGLRPLPLQPAPGRARAAGRVLLPRREVRRDPREVRRLPASGCSSSASTPTPAGAAATVLAIDTRLAAGPLGARGDPRRPEDLQPADARPSSSELCPAFDWDAYVRNLGGSDEHASPRCASGSRRTSPTSRPCSARSDRRLEDLAAQPGAALGGAPTSPTTSSRPTSTSTAAPSTAPPSCGPAGSAAVELRRGRDRRGGRQASTSRGTSRRAPRR